jgi:iron complex transport system permease protein
VSTLPSRRPASVPAVGRAAGLGAASAALLLAVALSLAVGTRSVPPHEVVSALLNTSHSSDAALIREIRVPRTALAALVGVALALSGALMQSLTRNPIADPGLLGVNAGASAAVVSALAFLGATSIASQLPFAFAGAALAAVVVYVVAAAGRGGATAVRLALAGAALTAAATTYCYGVALSDPKLLERFNDWSVGSLADRGTAALTIAAPCVAVGALLCALLARSLNIIALGESTAQSLGVRPGRVRLVAGAAVTLLCGAATAAAGPIAFVGLIVAHGARSIAGADERWVLGYCALLGPTLMLLADTLGRVVVAPSELEVGVVVAFVGVPVFFALVRRKQLSGL